MSEWEGLTGKFHILYKTGFLNFRLVRLQVWTKLKFLRTKLITKKQVSVGLLLRQKKYSYGVVHL